MKIRRIGAVLLALAMLLPTVALAKIHRRGCVGL